MNTVVCLKSRTLLTCLLEKNPMWLNFLFGGRNFFFWGGESFMGGDIEVFFQGGVKFWEEKFRVQSPESRVQGPVQLLASKSNLSPKELL